MPKPRSVMNMRLSPIATIPSLKDRIYTQLKDRITGAWIYRPEARLRVDERGLAERLGISRTPLREALARLEQEGLVRVVARKGVFIVRKSKDEILEMILVWAALESMAARLATARASDAEIGSLRQMFATFGEDGEALRAHIDEYSDANLRFHQVIFELSQCRLLCETAERLLIHMQAIRARTITEDNRVQRSIIDHMHIIEALEARDADLAERLAREHALNLHAHVALTWVDLDAADSSAA